MNLKRITAVVGTFTLITSLFIAGCGSNTTNNDKVWRVGTDATYAPFGFKEKNTGKLDGFDIDIITAIAKEEGAEVDIQNLNFDALLPALQSNTLDIAISDMTISEERARSVDFSNPYYIAGSGLVVNTDNTNITSFKDLEGKRIGVSIGSTGAEIAGKIPNADVRQFNLIIDAFLELQNRGVDVVINDTPVNEFYVANKGRGIAKVVGEDYDAAPLGIAVKKGNTELLDKINSGLAKIKENGKYREIYKKWFGKEPPVEQ
ncbi:basic amino acid ABC transporter substrate-binding protein [Veillonella caviae]|uniref:basic amino acid ABC transporter substrate-binding protein n=1 Tax=Veillonella caviae TaxID=248316 RepID=UPI0023A7E1AA|nr:basic amino acid ABC transporter substrate-binding protein [Veillonella caviae]MCI5709022.1 basic amino acid ABC transporter substrate-binding protein [Veillonella caviae]MCI6407218.1 basic amino acid ABC transporter substrate-binding protein [Veillonella caviae]MDY6224685.1 basic amino acid ABC transporter substrate-binding protein [Veillonella caviae]